MESETTADFKHPRDLLSLILKKLDKLDSRQGWISERVEKIEKHVKPEKKEESIIRNLSWFQKFSEKWLNLHFILEAIIALSFMTVT